MARGLLWLHEYGGRFVKRVKLDSFVDRQRLWNWAFWASIAAFEALGLVLSRQT
jgi:hypothetical protein